MSAAAENEDPRPVSLWRRALAGLALVAALAVAAHFLVGARMSANRLQRMMGDLDKTDPEWRLDDILAAREDVPEAENSARVIVAVAGLIPRGWPAEAITKIDEGVGPPHRLPAEKLAALTRDQAALSPLLAKARRLAEMPRGRHRLVMADNPFYTNLHDQQRTRAVTTLLAADARHLAQVGKMDEAVASCRAAVNCSRSLAGEPFLISCLIRMTCSTTADEAIERCLSLGEAGEGELAKLANVLAEEEKEPPMLVGVFRSERASLHIMLNGLASGKFSIQDPLFQADTMLVIRDRVAGWQLRQEFRNEHPRMLELMNRAVEAARLPPHEQARPFDDLEREVKRQAVKSGAIRLLIPPLFNVLDRHRHHLAQTRSMRALVAAERHRLAKGAWPAKLDDLVPGLLDAVPLDPYDGKPLRYVRRGDGVTVYSIGLDLRDDGGVVDRKLPRGRTVDVGYRLWDVKHRGKPPPAAPAEGPK
jgi:hypothetical protein